MTVKFFNRNIPDECHHKMEDFSTAGDDVTWVAFPPGGGNRWSIVTKNGAFLNRNIPDECHQKMQDLSKGGAKIVRVAFPPQGGNAWSIRISGCRVRVRTRQIRTRTGSTARCSARFRCRAPGRYM